MSSKRLGGDEVSLMGWQQAKGTGLGGHPRVRASGQAPGHPVLALLLELCTRGDPPTGRQAYLVVGDGAGAELAHVKSQL